MGIITILWEKWVEFRRDFYKITLAAMIELSDSGCGITDNYERKLQRHCAEPKRTETV